MSDGCVTRVLGLSRRGNPINVVLRSGKGKFYMGTVWHETCCRGRHHMERGALGVEKGPWVQVFPLPQKFNYLASSSLSSKWLVVCCNQSTALSEGVFWVEVHVSSRFGT